MHHFFPSLKENIRKIVKDDRRKASCDYSVEELVMAAVMMYMLRSGSRNMVNQWRDHTSFRVNYQKLLGLRIPHLDTVDKVLERIPNVQLEALLTQMVSLLMGKRVFHKFRLSHQYFIIAIDGTGVFSFDNEPYEGCPYKTPKNDKRVYTQSVVEAKLVCNNGFAISIGSEWILNEDGKDKQDCEYNATMRLLDKLHRNFPRLQMCLVMDGLFLKYPIQKKIKDYGWEFIMVWKDKTKYELQDEIASRHQKGELQEVSYTLFPGSSTREEYRLEYSSLPLMNKDIEVYYLQGLKTQISTKCDIENKETRFVFMSSIAIDSQYVKDLFQSGRLRWKIENEGFNTQKNSDLSLHHKMNRNNLTAIKNYYSCLQIAHLLSQLMTLQRNSIARTYSTMKSLWLDFCAILRLTADYELPPYKLKYCFWY